MKRNLVSLRTAVVAAAFVLAAVGVDRPFRAAERPPLDLAGVFAGPGGLVRDTNGDGIPDAVATRIVVAATPSAGDVESAVNLAARLGYETTALTLPVVVSDADATPLKGVERPILVGRANAHVKRLEASGVVDFKGLQRGQGLIALVPASVGGADAIVVAGADDEGTVAAATELAARLPRLWGSTGATVEALEEQARSYLASKGVAVTSASVPSLVVDANRLGLVTVNLVVQTSGNPARAASALEDLDRAHSRGLEPRMLNFGNIATIAITIGSGGRTDAHAAVHRSGMSNRVLVPPIEPGELAADSPGQRGRQADASSVSTKSIDLANGYSIDGWFADSYADLIPDRTDTVLVLGDGPETLGAAHIAARLGLESTGVTVPIGKPAARVTTAAQEPNPILVGRSNTLVDQLARIGRVRFDGVKAGDGVVQMVPKAFGAGTATVVAGVDPQGTSAAAMYLGRRVPYIWETSPGAPSYQDVALETTRFFQARNPAGQASQALDELDAIVRDLKDKDRKSTRLNSSH